MGWMGRWVGGSVLDLKHAARGLRRHPVGTVASVLTLALGMGSTILVGSLARGILWDPLPYPESHRLVTIHEVHQGRERGASPAGYLDWRRRLRSFSHVVAYRASTAVVEAGGALVRHDAAMVSGNFFQGLAVEPVLGRGFLSELRLDGSVEEVVLSHALWSQELGGRRDVVGSRFRVDGRALTVVGVAPPGFAFPDGADLWIRAPHEVPPAGDLGGRVVEMRDAWYFQVVGRLAPGTSLDQARSEAGDLALELRRRHPEHAPDQGLALRSLKESTVAASRPFLLLLLAACALVLAATCANMTALSLVRWLGERRELTVRAALGSSGWRNARLVLFRTVLVCGAGGVLGFIGAAVGIPVLRAWLPASVPRLDELRVQADMAWLALGVTATATLLCGMLPARDAARAFRRRLATGRSTGGGRGPALVVSVEVALAVILLSSTVLLGRSVVALEGVAPGFRPQSLVTMRVEVPGLDTRSPEAQRAEWRRLVERARGVPGVVEAALSRQDPAEIGARATARIEGPDGFEDGPDVAWRPSSPGWFQALGMEILAGRALDTRDAEGTTDVVVVDESFARTVYGDGVDALGRRVSIGLDGHHRPLTIVGVVSATRNRGGDNPPFPVFYRPLAQVASPPSSWTLAVRVQPGSETSMVAAVREVLGAERGGVLVHDVATGEALMRRHGADRRFLLQLLAAFAAMALILGAVGVYAVAAGLVEARTREIGVRRAIGADVGAVVRDVLRTGFLPVAAGATVGLLGSLAAGHALRGLLYGVAPGDPLSMVIVVALLSVAALWALSGPALRAARVDPAVGLRKE